MGSELASFKKDWERWSPAERLSAVTALVTSVAATIGRLATMVA